MPSSPHDPVSALAMRTHYRQSESRAARLRLLVTTGQELTRLRPHAMCQQVLARACSFLAMDHGLVLQWDAESRVTAMARHGSGEHLDTLQLSANPALRTPDWQIRPGHTLINLLQVPLLGSDGNAFGALLLASSLNLRAPDDEDRESLQLLATLLAAHLENGRLLSTLQTRDRTLSELVERLLRAQEDERKRVAYDLHDGLAQTLAGLHQRLQGFAGRCSALPETLAADLDAILALAKASVAEGRQLISGLRPAVLDDFGLCRAIDKEADRLRDAAITVQWQTRCDTRLSSQIEIALFRVAQEAINNILKHARATHVRLSLDLHEGQVSLHVDDNGAGFILEQPRAHDDARHLGLATMHERASLLGGQLFCDSAPGAGTRVHARVPAPLHGTVE